MAWKSKLTQRELVMGRLAREFGARSEAHSGDYFSRSANCGDYSFKRHKLDKNNTLNPEGFGLKVKTDPARAGYEPFGS